MLSVAEASEQVLAAFGALGPEDAAIEDCLGRVLASDVLSPMDLPAWDNASMDGYAVRAVDVEGASAGRPVVLPVQETIAAGASATRPLAPGAATRIMTGAPVPEGADCVIRVEDTDGGDLRVAIRDARDAGRNVRSRGEELRSGDVALAAGVVIGPAEVGVLASVGSARVSVYKRPRIALLATGDELVMLDDFEAVRRGERVVSSNSYALFAALCSAGAEVLDLGIARDNREALSECLERAAGCDMLVTTGGVSAGKFDYTRAVVEELGGSTVFRRVQMRPGGPITFGALGTTPWFGLPGNPVSALVTFEIFVHPAIRKLSGEKFLFPRAVAAVLHQDITLAAPLTHFLRAVVETQRDGTLAATLTGAQGSGILTSMSRANALLVIPPERQRCRSGDVVSALLLEPGLVAPSLRLV